MDIFTIYISYFYVNIYVLGKYKNYNNQITIPIAYIFARLKYLICSFKYRH